jgi:hypothetical protein
MKDKAEQEKLVNEIAVPSTLDAEPSNINWTYGGGGSHHLGGNSQHLNKCILKAEKVSFWSSLFKTNNVSSDTSHYDQAMKFWERYLENCKLFAEVYVKSL